ncbi:hypothetical protein SAMN05216327_12352 [Dyadobacter sp. SG02]|nr:hypothetical protein SAMN05216327_12352 [Dyadobacter sp. SG02]
MRKEIKLHILFCLGTLLIFIGQPLIDNPHSVFGYFLFLCSIYMGRWIYGQSYTANWLDIFRMFFLSFFAWSIGGLAVFVSYVEPGLRWTHYLESLINIACFTALCLFAGFFCFKNQGKTAQALGRKSRG